MADPDYNVAQMRTVAEDARARARAAAGYPSAFDLADLVDWSPEEVWGPRPDAARS